MKRDLVALKFILKQVEEHDSPLGALRVDAAKADYLDALGNDQATLREFNFALELLKEEKFIVIRTVEVNRSDTTDKWDVLDRITWRGYNLLDALEEKRPLDCI